jgi:hypothetical protein
VKIPKNNSPQRTKSQSGWRSLLLFPLGFGILFLGIFTFPSCIQNGNTQTPAADSIASVAATDSFPLKKTIDQISYSIFYSGKNKISITNIRPNLDLASLQLAFAGAFTLLDDYTIDGLFIEKGIIKKKSANHHLGGGLLIDKSGLHIIKTFDGKLLTDHWRDSVAQSSSSFFQQIQLVREDSTLVFRKDKAVFQRRAVVIFKDGKTAMVESLSAITLQKFADDLVKMDVHNAIYTDMGGWDEAWYRDTKGKLNTIGYMRTSTARQSNWVVFEKTD